MCGYREWHQESQANLEIIDPCHRTGEKSVCVIDRRENGADQQSDFE